MGAFAIAIVVSAGLVIGIVVQVLTKPQSRYDWLFVALASAVGAYGGSEWLTQNVFVGLATGPSYDGLIIVPAVLVGLTVGIVADAFVRYIAFEPA